MKRKKLFYLILVLALTGCNSKSTNSTSIKTTSEINIVEKHSYDEIKDYQILWPEIFDIDSKNYFVYFFQRSCSHCESLKDDIIPLALDRGDIYFVEDSVEIKFTQDITPTLGIQSVDNLAILGFPSLIQINDKYLIRNVAGVSQIKAILSL